MVVDGCATRASKLQRPVRSWSRTASRCIWVRARGMAKSMVSGVTSFCGQFATCRVRWRGNQLSPHHVGGGRVADRGGGGRQ
eukprot:2664143-Lingulodinium_polyedra.AAC.1